MSNGQKLGTVWRLLNSGFRAGPVSARPRTIRRRGGLPDRRSLSARVSPSTRGSSSWISTPTLGAVIAGGLASAYTVYHSSVPACAEARPSPPAKNSDAEAEKASRPTFRLAEVKEHGPEAEEIWVIKGTGVYDITDWIDAHPGGKVILRGAGANIEPYWNIFTIHQKQEVYDILESYRIGDVDPQDLVGGAVPSEDVEDPFEHDPKRDPRLRFHSARPCNAETPAEELSDFITPTNLFYVRNHLWVPELPESSEAYTLTIELPSGDEKQYTLSDLRSKFPQHRITATLQCSGNRRTHMSLNSRQAQGLQWDVGAIGTATWTGVLLRDVLRDAGMALDPTTTSPLDPSIQHVHLNGSEAYGASIPIRKALDPHGDVLLAYDMNGVPISRDHGAPLRAIVPGTVGARWTKWLNRISLSDEESSSQWQRRDYKCFGPGEAPEESTPADRTTHATRPGAHITWDDAPAIQEMPVQSAITSVREIAAQGKAVQRLRRVYGLDEDAVEVCGYAVSGGGRAIVRVDVSFDGGHTWRRAQLLDPSEQEGGTGEDARGGGGGESGRVGDAGRNDSGRAWAWKRWRLTVPRREVGAGAGAGGEICVKAVDEANNGQPEGHGPSYNFRGNLATAWHRVRLRD